MKNFLVKMNDLYYSMCKETSFMRIFSLVLVFIFIPIISQPFAFAGSEVQSFEEYRDKGLEAQQKGFLYDAINYYEKALYSNPTKPEIYNDLGVVYDRMGNLYEAKRYYEKALEVDRSYLPAYSNLGYLYKRQGDLVRSADYFKERMNLGGPTDPWSHEASAQLRVLSESSPELKKWLVRQEAARLNEEVTSLSQQVKEEEERVFYQKIMDSEKGIEEALAYEEAGLYEKAIAQYNQALVKTPDNPRILERRKGAELKLKRKHVEEKVKVALEKLEAGDLDSSEEEFRNILAIIPNN